MHGMQLSDKGDRNQGRWVSLEVSKNERDGGKVADMSAQQDCWTKLCFSEQLSRAGCLPGGDPLQCLTCVSHKVRPFHQRHRWLPVCHQQFVHQKGE
jgi:hypothetical protein